MIVDIQLPVYVAFSRAPKVFIRYIERAKASIVISVQASDIDAKIILSLQQSSGYFHVNARESCNLQETNL